MAYTTLTKIYYRDSDRYTEAYEDRFNSPFTKHLPFSIREYNHNHTFPAFFCYGEDIARCQEAIMIELLTFSKSLEMMPSIGIQQFLYSSLVEEIKSSNDLVIKKDSRPYRYRLNLGGTEMK